MKLPTIISRFFEPMFILPAFLFLTVWTDPLTLTQKNHISITILGMVAPLVLLFLWALRIGKISNFDVTHRQERPLLLMTLLLMLGIYYFIVRSLGDPALTQYFTLFIYWVIGFAAITMEFKISGHTGILTLVVILLLLRFGIKYWPATIVIPLIVWARVTRKNHTVPEAIAGVVYSIILVTVWRLWLK
jgi:hypothetical protein